MGVITSIVVPLEQAAGLPIAQIGGKAANLAALMQAGFRVPNGFVITTAAFSSFTTRNGFRSGTQAEIVRATPLPRDIEEEIERSFTRLGGPVAVRSSGVAEDLGEASYAGQYETVLAVDSADGVVAALLRCWSSAFDVHVARYHGKSGGRGIPAMAVLVQRMVQADVAGVAFSANPVTGDRGEVVINAIAGLADRLMAGEVDGEQWMVGHGRTALASLNTGVLDAARVSRVAELARAVEAYFGTPQDIEWAMVGETPHLLQARPISTLPPEHRPVPVEIPPGYWEREVSHAPKPLTPFTSSFWHDSTTEGLRVGLAEFGLLIETIEFRSIGGWTYMRFVPLGGKDHPAPPSWMMPILIRVMPSLRTRARRCADAMRGNRPGAIIDRWYAEWRPMLDRRLLELRRVPLVDLGDEELLDHLGVTVAFVREASRVHFTLHVAMAFPLCELASASREILGWEDNRVWDLVAGTSQMSTEPARRLAELARTVDDSPELRAIVEGSVDALPRVLQADPGFAAAFETYVERYGHRTLSYEVAEPTLAEMPSLFLGLIANQLARDFEPGDADMHRVLGRRNALAAARQALATRIGSERDRWERALDRATHAYPVREDNAFYTIGGPLAILRYAALELGRRLVARSQLATAEDCFWLTINECTEALRDRRSRAELVSRRRAEAAWVADHPGRASYGEQGSPPSLDSLPPEVRRAHEALDWYPKQVMELGLHGADAIGDGITGIPASHGRYSGRVRLVMSEAEFDRIEAGDVLVCPSTSPVWSVVFPSIGALVTDAGGALSHPAIIAREYGVPAVVATGNATRLLRDGQTVTVDGTAGIIVPH